MKLLLQLCRNEPSVVINKKWTAFGKLQKLDLYSDKPTFNLEVLFTNKANQPFDRLQRRKESVWKTETAFSKILNYLLIYSKIKVVYLSFFYLEI